MRGAKQVSYRCVEASVRSSGWTDRLYETVFHQLMSRLNHGRLLLERPDGKKIYYGDGSCKAMARIKVVHKAFFKKCVLFGDVGFGESFVDGNWETDDITRVIEWMILNLDHHPILMDDREKSTTLFFLRPLNNVLSWFHRNTLSGARKNIQEHYDLNNEFFSLFLDDTMTYSCALFDAGHLSLEEAQINKYETWCRKLCLEPKDHVLEIGCGWGGFAIHAARQYGCHIKSITISRQQFELAQQRVRQAGVDDKVEVVFQDYRTLHGQFDKIISIEMLEAVGHDFHRDFFARCHRCLKKDGLLGLQVILSPDHRYNAFRKNIDWIQKHIFPGSLLPSFEIILKNIRATGDLNLFNFEDITPCYGRTLCVWRERFLKRLNDVRMLGFSTRFIRKWHYYLSYCEAAFNMRNISVAQIVFFRPNNQRLQTSTIDGSFHKIDSLVRPTAFLSTS